LKDASEARLVMGILDSAGVKSFLGPDNVENVDDFKGSFDDGVGIQVMNFQSQYAVGGLRRRFQPEPEEDTPDDKDYAILCPKCNSPDTVFRGLDVEPSGRLAPDAKNNWSCDACGHQWKDDGIVEKP
jgi:hypothetical protein